MPHRENICLPARGPEKEESYPMEPENSVTIKTFEQSDLLKVLEFESELRKQEPDTYYWEPDDSYAKMLEASFADQRFNTALSLLALKNGRVIGRVDASIIASRCDASCCSAYLDWICVLKSERHGGVAQMLLRSLRNECKALGVEFLIALTAGNEEAQKFYKNVENASMHDTGIWISTE